jgi:hypothetical protein
VDDEVIVHAELGLHECRGVVDPLPFEAGDVVDRQLTIFGAGKPRSEAVADWRAAQ